MKKTKLLTFLATTAGLSAAVIPVSCSQNETEQRITASDPVATTEYCEADLSCPSLKLEQWVELSILSVDVIRISGGKELIFPDNNDVFGGIHYPGEGEIQWIYETKGYNFQAGDRIVLHPAFFCIDGEQTFWTETLSIYFTIA